MSELTICNFCDYSQRQTEAQRKGWKIQAKMAKPFDPRFPKMRQVFINNKPIGVYYIELGKRCAC